MISNKKMNKKQQTEQCCMILKTKYGKIGIPQFSNLSIHSYSKNKNHQAKIPSMFGGNFM